LLGWGTLAMAGLSGNRGFYGLHPDDGFAECLAERLALGVGERRLARLADRRRLLARVGRGRVFHQRVDDGEEVALAAAVGLAVALDQARAFGNFARQRQVAPRRLDHQPEPALDQRLLLAVAVAHRPPGAQPGEAAHQQVAEHAGGLDVHADVVGVELAAPFRPR